MRKFKALFLLQLIGLIPAACGSGQFLGPTLTPTSTITLTPTLTPAPTLTSTPTTTNTPIPIATATALPGLGIRDAALVDWAEDFYFTLHDVTVDGLPARKYVSSEGYTVLTLVGESPYVQQVILEIDMKKENPLIATTTWIYILEMASNYAGKSAADWVHATYPKAVQSGREEQIFKDANIILEVEGNIFRLTIEPAINK